MRIGTDPQGQKPYWLESESKVCADCCPGLGDDGYADECTNCENTPRVISVVWSLARPDGAGNCVSLGGNAFADMTSFASSFSTLIEVAGKGTCYYDKTVGVPLPALGQPIGSGTLLAINVYRGGCDGTYWGTVRMHNWHIAVIPPPPVPYPGPTGWVDPIALSVVTNWSWDLNGSGTVSNADTWQAVIYGGEYNDKLVVGKCMDASNLAGYTRGTPTTALQAWLMTLFVGLTMTILEVNP